ncbi:MAG: hypothetical protein ACOYLX_20580, partial [Burkholderiaceae bacterium]
VPATFSTSATDLPAGTTIDAVYLYWTGNQRQSVTGQDCTSSAPDTSVTLDTPGGTPRAVGSDVCWCAESAAGSYDMWTCRADISAAIIGEGTAQGSWTVSDYAGLNANSTTSSHAASVVVIASNPAWNIGAVHLFDGLRTLENTNAPVTAPGLAIGAAHTGKMAFFAVSGSSNTSSANEFVQVQSRPAGVASKLSDVNNPVTNPLNNTISVVSPVISNSLGGVDIDAFDITPYLVSGDTSLDVTVSSASDKAWISYIVTRADAGLPDFGTSTKTALLQDDLDGDGEPTPGDTVRYTISMRNSGSITGTIDVLDVMPEPFASWDLVSVSGTYGADLSDSTGLYLEALEVGAGATVTIVLDVVVASDATDTEPMQNTVLWSAPAEGGAGGQADASSVIIRVDTDGDGTYDTADYCPDLFDPAQLNTDLDSRGDACDNCPLVANSTQTDSDGDGNGNLCDLCAGSNDSLDADRDGAPDGCDVCPGFSDGLDSDNDTVPNGCDVCSGGDDRIDSDLDTVPNACDVCSGGDDRIDADVDTVPDTCDVCPGGDDRFDADADGVPNGCDQCPGFADGQDADRDGVPNGCDVCPGSDDLADADFDFAPDGCDACPGSDDRADNDRDGVADGCDVCEGSNDLADADLDTVPNGCDTCSGGDDRLDADLDLVPDACDVCANADDRVDTDRDGVP